MFSPVARYREYLPCEALRPYVRRFFMSTMPPEGPARPGHVTREVVFHDGEPFWSSLFADGHVSIVFSFGSGYCVSGLWCRAVPGHVIGPMTTAHASSPGSNLVQIGAYCRAADSSLFTGAPAGELRNRIVPLDDLWGIRYRELEGRLLAAHDGSQRIELLESALLSRIGEVVWSDEPIDIAGLTSWIQREGGKLPLSALAQATGVSRQHLTRVFHRRVGVTPKLYSRLARFRASLARISQSNVDWAEAAVELGYSDQSHMIGEFKQFSGATPAAFSRHRGFHPFVEPRVEGK